MIPRIPQLMHFPGVPGSKLFTPGVEFGGRDRRLETFVGREIVDYPY